MTEAYETWASLIASTRAPVDDAYTARVEEREAEHDAADLALSDHVAGLEAERDALADALQRIVQWADAYPVDVFPVPDRACLADARRLLDAAGMSLDAISAHAMRRVVTGVGKIAREALAAQDPPHAHS